MLSPWLQELLQNPQAVCWKKLPYHAPTISLDSPRAHCLDGDWKFCFVPDISQIQEDFQNPEFDDRQWDTIPVPSNWQTQGICPPKYINTRYEFEPEREKLCPPQIPERENAAGLYRRTFTLPRTFQEPQVLLSFQGIESGLLVWVNGHFAGYSSNGRSPSEFQITPYLKEGENLLAVCVLRFTAASYLECQDMWRMSGIIRSVWLLNAPDCQLFDLFSFTDWAGEIPILQLEAKVLNHQSRALGPVSVTAELFAPSGESLAKADGKVGNGSSRWGEWIFYQESMPLEGGTMGTAYLSIPVKDPLLWSDETPTLYQVVLTLRDSDGTPIETCRFRHGFRRIWIEGGELFLNGKSMKLKGVNRHEYSVSGGHVVTLEEMKRDILLMKQNNVNAVRCSHYPNDSRWYDLCDEYGLLVMDEACVESHGISYRRNVLPGNDPRWLPALLDRVSAMVQGEKNHPSVLIWSLGNELGFGETVAQAAAYCRAYDPTRLIHKRQMNSIADMDSETYPSPQHMVERAEKFPHRAFLTNEYAHAMGNAMGNLKEYWDAIYAHKQLIGGFVWEWCDHGMEKPEDRGKRHFYYGGDFQEKFHDGNFCIDGILTADRLPTAKLAELKKVHEPVQVVGRDPEKGEFTLCNGYAFTPLSILCLRWKVWKWKDGKQMLWHGEQRLPPIGPGERYDFQIEEISQLEERGMVEFSLVLAENTSWAEAGHEVAFSQFPIGEDRQALSSWIPLTGENLKIQEETDGYRVLAGETEMWIGRESGLPIGLRQRGKPVTEGEFLNIQFWRAPTDNDRRSGYFQKSPSWKECGLDRMQGFLIRLEQRGERQITAVRRYTGTGEQGYIAELQYTFSGDGRVLFEIFLSPFGDLPVLPRVGVMLRFPAAFQKMAWYGLGPWETYPDRKACGRLGYYEKEVKDCLSRDYVRPQENGSHQETWLTALSNGVSGVLLQSCQPSSMGVLPYTPQELEQTPHLHQLPDSPNTYLFLDLLQAGLGNRSCGPETLPDYQIQPLSYAYAFYLLPCQPDFSDVFERMQENPIPETPIRWMEERQAAEKREKRAEEDYRDPSDPDVRRAMGMAD